MIKAFIKATDQILDPLTRRVVWTALIFGVGIFILVWTLVGALIFNTTFFTIGWLDLAINWLGGLATGALTWLLFPSAISVIIGFFLEDIANAVERKHYPHLAPINAISTINKVLIIFRFLTIMLLLNIIMLPFLFTGPIFPIIFYSVNGYLFGREYFELVAFRRMGIPEANALKKKNAIQIFLVGVFVTVLLTVPFLNLLTPIIITGMMVHLFEDFRSRA